MDTSLIRNQFAVGSWKSSEIFESVATLDQTTAKVLNR